MAEQNNTSGKLIVVSGPSGVGKGTICDAVANRLDNVFLSVSATTRTPGKGEVDGKNYIFMTTEQFEEKLRDEDFLEYAQVFDNYYGTPWSPIKQALREGKSTILEVDVQGGMAVRRVYDDVVLIFILPPSQTDLQKRMDGRARGEDAETQKKRIDFASQETAAAWQYYDHMVINADIEQAIEEVIGIIQSNGEIK